MMIFYGSWKDYLSCQNLCINGKPGSGPQDMHRTFPFKSSMRDPFPLLRLGLRDKNKRQTQKRTHYYYYFIFIFYHLVFSVGDITCLLTTDDD